MGTELLMVNGGNNRQDWVVLGNIGQQWCQEIGLVTVMFFFKLLFSYVFLQFPSMFPVLTHSQSFVPLSANYLRHSKMKDIKKEVYLIEQESLKSFYDLKSQDS